METARDYLTAFYADDRPATRALLADDFDFAGPFVAVVGANDFLDSARRLLDASEGTDVIRSWEDEGEVCVVHEVSVGGRRVTMADWLTIEEGRVARERVYFDAQQLAAALG
jgi:ketosteroid isomerase-like protein